MHLSENLKKEMRHCWYTDGRRESVAEHSWRLTLMVFRLAHQLDRPVDVLKCMKMALIHDLPEAIVGDLPLTLQTKDAESLQFQREKDAIAQIESLLGDVQGTEIRDLWYEYEDQKTYESKFIKALDKLEAWIQHEESPIESWEHREKVMVFEDKYLIHWCQFDSYLLGLAQEVIGRCVEKLAKAGEDLQALRQAIAS